MARLSAIIPVYNGEATIAEAVDSALALANECDLEVVVVDDGSTDSTPAILQRFGDRIKVLTQDNLGVSAARNHAVRESRGEYLSFLDADDLWLPGRLSKAVVVLDSDPTVGLVYSDFRIVDIKSGDLLREAVSEGVPSLEEMFQCRFCIQTSTVTVRRDLFARCGGFDERLSYGEDFYFFLCARQYCNFAHIPEHLVIFRPASGFRPDRRKKPPSTRVTFERVMRERYGRRAKTAARMARDEWASMLFGMALHEIDERRPRLAFRTLVELLRYRPSYLVRATDLTNLRSSRNIQRMSNLLTMLIKVCHSVIHRFQRFISLTILDSWSYVPLMSYADFTKLALFWKVSPYALQNYASLSNVYDLASSIERSNLAGSFVECGVWRGGCAAVMAVVAAKANSARKMWLFDSFEGMPEARKEDVGEDARCLANGRMGGQLVPVGTNVAAIEDVKGLLFNKLNINPDNVEIIKGWFQNTLPAHRNQIGPIAILRVDADWYESTTVCLDQLYDNVIRGGYIIIDDYGYFPGCKKAVDEFIQRKHLQPQLTLVDYSRVYFRKT